MKKLFLIISILIVILIYPDYFFTGLGITFIIFLIILFIIEIGLDIYLIIIFFIQYFKKK